MSSYGMLICDLIWDTISSIALPREAVIVNVRVGIVFWIMWLGAFIAAVFSLRAEIHKEHEPIWMNVQFWREGGDYLGTPAHCVDFADYKYIYSNDWPYEPTRCRTLLDGQDFVKAATSMSFMTLIQETNKRIATGADCDSLEANCTTAGTSAKYACSAPSYDDNCSAVPVANVSDKSCLCKSYEEYYMRNQEKSKLMFRHSYKVKDSWYANSVEMAGSGVAFYTTGPFNNTKTVQKVLLTRLLKGDGTPCLVGEVIAKAAVNGTPAVIGKAAKSVYPSGEDIGGTIEEWLACGNFTLDSQSELTRSRNPEENIAPHIRTTGVKINLAMTYNNKHPVREFDGKEVNTVCDITVQVLPAWTGRGHDDLGAGMPADSREGAIRQTRNRYFYSAVFQFQQDSSFSYFNPHSLLNGIVKAIVLFGVPTTIARLICMYGIGLVSEIYKKFLRQPFNIFEELHKVSIALMFSAIGFRLWTKQFDTMKPVTEMSQEKLKQCMSEAFDHELKPDASGHNDIDEGEWQRCSDLVLQGIDSHTDEGIQQDEYVHAACGSANSFGDSRLMLKFFESRKRWPIEMLLDPTRRQIRVANTECDKRLERMESRQSAEAATVGEDEVVVGAAAAGAGAVVAAVVVSKGAGGGGGGDMGDFL